MAAAMAAVAAAAAVPRVAALATGESLEKMGLVVVVSMMQTAVMLEGGMMVATMWAGMSAVRTGVMAK